MSIQPGCRVGPYEVLSHLGSGGMGEVFRARDSRLHREVALKVIASSRGLDAESVARFEREARAAAALNHPGIISIFDVGSQDGAPFIVSELLAGNSLRHHLIAGAPLSERRALEWGAQIADALATAHAKNIVHRDLKPENLFVLDDDRIKILDFGLARLLEASSSQSTTVTVDLQTEPGMVLGTAPYMSPEQVAGHPADARSDIFSLGVVLYELITGRHPFKHATAVETMSAIIKDDATAPSAVNPKISPMLERIIVRCLERAPGRRFQSASDLAFALSTALVGSGSQSLPAVSTATSPRRWGRIAALLVTLLAVFVLGAFADRLFRPQVRALSKPKEFAVDPEPVPLSEAPVPIALSPDGSMLAYAAGTYEGSQLFVRPLNSLKPVALTGTQAARDQFFSPDGRWIAFRAQGELRKVPIDGGPAVTIARIGASGTLGGTWNTDGWIFYSFGTHIWRVRDSGGEPEIVTTPDSANGELLHYWPQVLPGANSLLVTVVMGPSGESSRISVIPLSGGAARTLVNGAGYGRYLSSGHLFYTRGNTGFVVPFDVKRQVITGEPKAVISNLATGSGASAEFAAADDGTIAFVEQLGIDQRMATSVDRTGHATSLGLPANDILGLAVSPDDKRLAINVRQGSSYNLWIHDFASKSFEPLTMDSTVTGGPAVWRPDARGLTYARRAGGKSELVTQDLEGLRNSRVAWSSTDQLWPGSWSANGQQLFFMRADAKTSGDIDMIQEGSTQPRMVLGSRMTEWGARISPDGAWLAYVSNATGGWEVYIQPWPGPGAARRVSFDGGDEAVWAKNGRELYYRNGTKLMAAPVSSSPFAVGAPHLLFDFPYVAGQPGLPNYDVSGDSQKFYMVQRGAKETATQTIRIVVNWVP